MGKGIQVGEESSAAVLVAGRYAYAADWEKGLRIVDISKPCQPRQVGFYQTSGSAVGVAAAGTHAYLSPWGGGLHITDVSDPAHILEIGSLEGQGWYKHAVVYEVHAYGACGWGGLRVVDIADPAHPAEVGVHITPGHAEDVAVWSTDDPPELYAAVANALEGLRMVDVADPANPVEVGFYDTPGQAFGVTVAGSYAYVADDEGGLRVLYLTDPNHPVELGFYVVLHAGVAADKGAARGTRKLVIDRDQSLIILTQDDASEIVTSFVPRDTREWPSGCPSNINSTRMEVQEIAEDPLTIGVVTFSQPILVRDCPPDPLHLVLRGDGANGRSGNACPHLEACIFFGR